METGQSCYGDSDAFTELAVTRVLNRWNKAVAMRPLLPMKRGQPRHVVARVELTLH
jgi:hypothetical protein